VANFLSSRWGEVNREKGFLQKNFLLADVVAGEGGEVREKSNLQEFRNGSASAGNGKKERFKNLQAQGGYHRKGTPWLSKFYLGGGIVR